MSALLYSQLPDAPLTLVTGATGTLGQELLKQLLERPRGQFAVLARGGSKKTKGGAEPRVKAILRKHLSGSALEKAWERIVVLDGDICEPQLGLSNELYEGLVERLERVLHCAAAVRFDQPLAEARQINLEGTRTVLDLALAARQRGQVGRVDYVGTAYVCGKRRGVICEDELEHKKSFHNTYEQSKYEAELLVRRYRDELPIAIYRPSVIVGHSQTGETSNFKAFYWPMRVYSMGQMRLLPGVAECRVDLVPVDYVAAAVVALGERAEAIGNCYHLTAGRDNLITLREIMDAAISFFKIKPPRLIHPVLLKPAEGWLGRFLLNERTLKTLRLGEPYYPYFALDLEFDNAQAHAALVADGIRPTPPREFFDRLFRYCVETDWGRKTSGCTPSTASEETEEAALAETIMPLGEIGSQQVAGAI